MTWRRIGIVLLFASLAAACDRPTAPEAREIARKVERGFAEGDFEGIGNMFRSMGTAGNFSGINYAGALTVARDGHDDTINGFIVEEVLVAPRGLGTPIVTRTLVAWPKDFAFAIHATTEEHPGIIERARGSNTEALLPRISMSVHDRRSENPWVAEAGRIEIGEAMVDKACGTADHIPVNNGLPDVKCELALYEVSVRGDLVRQTESNNPLLGPLRARRHLYARPQRVPGVRFTITCPELKEWGEGELASHNWGCFDPVRFWRNNALFASDLRVDVGSMTKGQGGGWYRRSVRGNLPEFPDPTTVRWTIHTPDGRLIERDSAGPPDVPPYRRDLDAWMLMAKWEYGDLSIQTLVPARLLDPKASRYAILVIDFDMITPTASSKN